jgi:hypothetical protein
MLKLTVQQHLESGLPPAEIAKNIGDSHAGLYWDRSEDDELTGEWIIFAEHDGKNYYLCLATRKEGYDVIADKIKSECCPEFPFLQFCLR